MGVRSQPPVVEDRYRLTGATLDAKIRIERVVARGGFGVVYRGFHVMLRAPVALKVLDVPGQYSEAVREEFRRRFMQEAQLVYRLTHPAVVRLLDHGISDVPTGEVVPWMVLEWLDGVTLARALREREGVGYAPREALALLRPVVEALASVHAQGVAHRDVTPANIFLCRGPAGLAARLIDFGVARTLEPHESPGTGRTSTQSTITAFSRPYAAPEQLGHARTGPWTDVHALGLVLTEMMTLRPPYGDADAPELLAAAMDRNRPTPAAFGVDVGPFEGVLRRAMALQPRDRYAHAGELLAALDGAARSTPRGPWTRPHAKAALALGLTLLVGGGAGLAAMRRDHGGAHTVGRRPPMEGTFRSPGPPPTTAPVTTTPAAVATPAAEATAQPRSALGEPPPPRSERADGRRSRPLARGERAHPAVRPAAPLLPQNPFER